MNNHTEKPTTQANASPSVSQVAPDTFATRIGPDEPRTDVLRRVAKYAACALRRIVFWDTVRATGDVDSSGEGLFILTDGG